MIFYGTRAKNIRNGQMVNIECPNCQETATMKYSVFAKYAHVYWIPFFPMKKITVSECNSCKKTFESLERIDAVKVKFKREKEKNPMRYPVWMYSGLFIIAGLMGFGYYDSQKTDMNSAEYVKNPKVGDVYYLKLENKHYTTARIDKVTRTEAYVTFNDYEIDLESDTYKLDEAKNYTTSKDTLDVIQLQKLFKDKTITEIVRN